MIYEKNIFAEYLTEEDKKKYKTEDENITARFTERYIPLEIPEDVKHALEEFRGTVADKLANYGLPNRINDAEIDYVGYRYVKQAEADQLGLNGESIDNHVVIAISTQTPDLMRGNHII